MKVLHLNRDIDMIGFADYITYKPYKEKAATNRRTIYKGEPQKVRPMFIADWMVQDQVYYNTKGTGRYINFMGGRGFDTKEESWQSALQALDNPKFIIVYRK